MSANRVVEETPGRDADQRRRQPFRARTDRPDRRGGRESHEKRGRLQQVPCSGRALRDVRPFDAGQRGELSDDDERRRAAHEAGDERVGDEARGVARAERAQHDLQHAGNHHGRAGNRDNRARALCRRRRKRRIGGERGDEACEDQRRRGPRPASGLRGAAEKAGDEMAPDRRRKPRVDADVEVGRPERREGKDPEREREAQVRRRAGHAAGEIAAQRRRNHGLGRRHERGFCSGRGGGRRRQGGRRCVG